MLNPALDAAVTGGDPSLSENERYRLLVHALTDYAVFMLEPDGTVASWNAGAERFMGYTAHEILGRHFSQFYTPEDRAAGASARALQTAAEEGRFEFEGWRLRQDGTRFWSHVVIDPIRASDGRLVGFAKVTRDLTDRRAAEESLRRSEEQFRLLVQSVTDYAIYMLDANGIVVSWNPGAQRIKGYAPAEIVGRHFSSFYTEEDRAAGEPARALAQAANEGRFEKEGWRVRKDGTRFRANVVIDAIRDPWGNLLGFAKVTRDVTERHEAQKALEEARESFFQAQKMEAIGQLTGGVAHDFNNLLMAVIGSLELLRKRVPGDPKSLQLIDNAMQGAQRGASLTQRMLAFARRQDLVAKAVNVPLLVQGMVSLLQRTIGPQISIETRFPPALPTVSADPNQLELALLNLAVNARDAMPEGGPLVIGGAADTIRAGHRTGLAPGDYVRLWVSDAGAGMDPETLAHATEPFFTTKGIGKGTGLGLSMVHGMTEQLGGRLLLDSEPGRGTTVEIWLPIGGPVAAAAAPPAVKTTDAPTKAAALRILAVDDDSLVLMNTAAMLEDLGHCVFEATSGRKALDVLEREAIDLVITDQAMPNMTGLELAQEIRARRSDMPIILATGYAELPASGGTGFGKLDKPFFQQQLEAAIAAATAGSQPASRPLP